VAGGGGDQAIQQIGCLQFVAPAELLDDALDVPPALAGVLDEVEVFVATDLLDADERGPAPWCRQDTTVNRGRSSPH
jgi:hypothetical protein